jgi:hypothetical protein
VKQHGRCSADAAAVAAPGETAAAFLAIPASIPRQPACTVERRPLLTVRRVTTARSRRG